MLEPAFLHKDRINELYRKQIFTPEFKFLCFGNGSSDFELEIYNTDEEYIQFASENLKGEVCGFFEAEIDRELHKVDSLTVIRLSDDPIFSRDFHRFIKSLVNDYRFTKISFEAVVGSPGEKVYDSHLHSYNARIVGVKRKEVRLRDGNIYDLKLYEIPGYCPLNKTGPDVD